MSQLEKQVKASIQKSHEHLERIYSEAFDDLHEEMATFCAKVGIVCLLSGILCGMGLAFFIQWIFG